MTTSTSTSVPSAPSSRQPAAAKPPQVKGGETVLEPLTERSWPTGQRGRITIGVVVGCDEPPAGSTVMPTRFAPPGTVATRRGTWPVASGRRSPAGRMPAGPIIHSWYVFELGSAGRPDEATTTRSLEGAETRGTVPPPVARAMVARASGADSTAEMAWLAAVNWSSRCWPWTATTPAATATARQAAATRVPTRGHLSARRRADPVRPCTGGCGSPDGGTVVSGVVAGAAAGSCG